MMRLAKYLKPFAVILIAAVALLFIQANCDLALPDYMSRIVNVGIQQGGIESAVPKAVRLQTMNKLTLFLDEEEKATVISAYTLVDRDSALFDDYIDDYEVLGSEPVYVLDKLEQSDIETLNAIIGRAILAVHAIERITADPDSAAGMPGGGEFAFPDLPEGTDVFALLSKLPPAQLAAMTSAFGEQFASMDDTMIVQAAAAAIVAEYEAIGIDLGRIRSSYIINMGILMLLVSLLSVACSVTVGFIAAKTGAGMARDIRKAIFEKVESFSNAEFDRFSSASLITRSTNDITQIQMVVIMIIRMVFYAPIVGVGAVIRALGKASSMWWVIAVAVGALLILILAVFKIAVPKFKLIQRLIDRLNLVSRETLAGMMVIRAFNRQKYEEGRFDEANKDLTANSLFVNRVMVVMMPLMMLIMNGISILIIWVGAQKVAQSAMQVGDMMAFLQYTMQIVFAFLMFSMLFIFLPRASVSGERIADVLESEPTIIDPEKPKSFGEPFAGSIEFQNVCFRYPGAEEDVLHDINFTARQGETTAFIGATGSGKTTVVNLIPRFYDVTEGSILVNGTDIRDITQHDLRDKIGYVPQKSFLFSGTVDSNLKYADENASTELITAAVETAQVADFISESENGIESEIAQGGANVSGGQKQRLSIARALVKNPPVFILDDSFSSLDFTTDAALRRELKKNTKGSTVLIVTQRVSTIKNADQIIVLDEGRIVGKGTHKELMDTCETYREIALSQLSIEELS